MFQNIAFYYLGVVRPVDQEAIAIKNMVCYSQVPRGGRVVVRGENAGQPVQSHPHPYCVYV